MKDFDYSHAVVRSISFAEERYKAPRASNNPPLAYAERIQAENDRFLSFVVSLSVLVKEVDPDLSDALLKFSMARDVRDKR